MSTTFNRIVTLAIILALIALTAMLLTQRSFGSVEYAGAGYQATSTRNASGVAMGSPNIISLGQGILGSIVITGANTGVINFYDATSTRQHSDYATTTIATIPASAAAGTYVFDAAYTRGLVVEIIGTVGSTTITWKK